MEAPTTLSLASVPHSSRARREDPSRGGNGAIPGCRCHAEPSPLGPLQIDVLTEIHTSPGSAFAKQLHLMLLHQVAAVPVAAQILPNTRARPWAELYDHLAQGGLDLLPKHDGEISFLQHLSLILSSRYVRNAVKVVATDSRNITDGLG